MTKILYRHTHRVSFWMLAAAHKRELRRSFLRGV